jgi:hypothetical protein
MCFPNVEPRCPGVITTCSCLDSRVVSNLVAISRPDGGSGGGSESVANPFALSPGVKNYTTRNKLLEDVSG